MPCRNTEWLKKWGLCNQHPPTHLTLFLFFQTLSSLLSLLWCLLLRLSSSLNLSSSISLLHCLRSLCLSAQPRRRVINPRLPPVNSREKYPGVLAYISPLVFSNVVVNWTVCKKWWSENSLGRNSFVQLALFHSPLILYFCQTCWTGSLIASNRSATWHLLQQ